VGGAATVTGSVDGLVDTCRAREIDIAVGTPGCLTVVEPKVLSLRISWYADGTLRRVR
jgi:hypothetical protein